MVHSCAEVRGAIRQRTVREMQSVAGGEVRCGTVPHTHSAPGLVHTRTNECIEKLVLALEDSLLALPAQVEARQPNAYQRNTQFQKLGWGMAGTACMGRGQGGRQMLPRTIHNHPSKQGSELKLTEVGLSVQRGA